MTIVEVAGGFQISTRKEFGSWVRKFHERSRIRLSQAALETLSIIAFKQPVTRVEVDSVRGVDSGGVIRTLMELNMIRIVGRSEGIGRPMLFGTTKEFMVHFGLKTLADLPRPKELEELLAGGERKALGETEPAEPVPAEGDSGSLDSGESDGAGSGGDTDRARLLAVTMTTIAARLPSSASPRKNVAIGLSVEVPGSQGARPSRIRKYGERSATPRAGMDRRSTGNGLALRGTRPFQRPSPRSQTPSLASRR